MGGQLLLYLAFIISGLIAGYYIRLLLARKNITTAEARAQDILKRAQQEAEDRKRQVEIEAKELLYKLRSDFERETKERRQELSELEKRLLQREENLERKLELLENREKELERIKQQLEQHEEQLGKREHELNNIIREEKFRLQQISGMSAEEARQQLLKKMEEEIRNEANLLLKQIEDETRAKAEEKAREIVSLAIQRCAAEHTADTTISLVNLPNDEMKGRIIGREGRNIRTFEMLTGVDVIIDDTPEAVTLSCFDPYRREIAKIAMEKLVEDGRIHPARIEEMLERAKREIDNRIREEGERTCLDLGVHNVHPELIKLIGKLRYRSSYGQNVLQHSKEVAYLMGVMASELDLDFNLARRIGLLHDIGKAVDQNVEGTHTKIGMELAKKYGENEVVVNAIGSHHQDIEQKTVYAVLVQAADAISGARPGARRETLESYIKRLTKLEEIANSFPGVEKSYAIQAGREVRVMVYPDKVNDELVYILARDIKKRIEEELEYPGQVKVTVIRETRAVEYAK